MALVTYEDLCIDVDDLHTSAASWAEALGLQVVPDEGEAGERGEVHLEGHTPRHTVWPCVVPEPRTGKHRLHRDVTLVPGSSVADLEAVGATVLRRPDDEVGWTVLADPDDNEFCVFGPGAA